MVRRGSTVRVRQRASLQIPRFVSRSQSVEGGDPGRFWVGPASSSVGLTRSTMTAASSRDAHEGDAGEDGRGHEAARLPAPVADVLRIYYHSCGLGTAAFLTRLVIARTRAERGESRRAIWLHQRCTNGASDGRDRARGVSAANPRPRGSHPSSGCSRDTAPGRSRRCWLLPTSVGLCGRSGGHAGTRSSGICRRLVATRRAVCRC